MTKDSNSVSTTLSPLSSDGRGRSYRPELGEAFEGRLDAAQQRLNRDDPRADKEERKDDKTQKRAEDKEGRSHAGAEPNKSTGKPVRSFGDQEQQGQNGRAPFEGLVQLAPQALRGPEMAAPVSGPTGMDPALIAQLDRIAAAIAESLPRDVDQQMSVAFGKANSLAQGAVLTRDASGAISVHIAGLHPGVTAAQSVRLQQELRARLMAKKLEVREIAFADKAQAGGNNPSEYKANPRTA